MIAKQLSHQAKKYHGHRIADVAMVTAINGWSVTHLHCLPGVAMCTIQTSARAEEEGGGEVTESVRFARWVGQGMDAKLS